MHKIAMLILTTIGLAMIFCIGIHEVLWGIYFAQLEILVFMAFMYFELKNK